MPSHPKLEKYCQEIRDEITRAQSHGSAKSRNIQRRVRRRCESTVAALLDEYTPKTARGYLSRIRKEFTDNAYVLKYLKLSEDITSDIARDYVHRIARQKTSSQRIITTAEAERLIGEARALLCDTNFLRITAGLLLITGRRPIEIVKTGQFTFPKTGRRTHIVFDGQAKTKEREQPAYRIPVLAERDLIKLALGNLRRSRQYGEFQSIDNDAIHTRISPDLNGVVKRHYGLLWSPKKLRALYAAYCYAKFAPVHYDEIVYMGEVLGHGHGEGHADIMTPQSYQQWFKLID